MVTVVKEPTFQLLSASDWRSFSCVADGAIIVTLRSGRVVSLNFEQGWVTDLTSTPRVLLWALPQLGPHVPASAAHDRALDLYDRGELTLSEAREVGFLVLQDLPSVGPLARFSWRAGVLFNDLILRPLKTRTNP